MVRGGLVIPVVTILVVTTVMTRAEIPVYQFQEDDQPSDSFLEYSGDLRQALEEVNSLSICSRFRFFSIWEVSRFVQIGDARTGDHAVQIDLDVRRIRVSIGGLRRYHKLDNNLKALTWHHFCVTYNTTSSSVRSYVDGFKQDVFEGHDIEPIDGTMLKIGAGDKENNFHGQITQFNIWSRPLEEYEILRLALCSDDLQGDVISWDSKWITHGKVTKTIESSRFFCTEVVEPKYYLFNEMSLVAGFTLCEGLGGNLPVPKDINTLSSTHQAITRLHSPVEDELKCKGYWVGVTDEESEGQWKQMTNTEPIAPFWRKAEPDGGTVQNCARGSMQSELALEDIPCHWKQCVLCVIPELPVWSLLGACQLHDRNRLFAPVQNHANEIHFEGYSYYTIERRNSTWFWIEKDGYHRNHTIAKLVTGTSLRKSWPIGRHEWIFDRPVCEDDPNTVRTLLLSPCTIGQFTCDDATCIPLFQRCDLKPDCRDGSDEKHCRLVKFPPTYRYDIPPAALGSENPLQVSLHVTLESADIDTASMMMHVNYNLTMTWNDPRLSFLNLNEDRTLNRVKQETVESIWIPVVDFTNTRGNHYTLSDHESTMMVNMQSRPTLGDDSHAEEALPYFLESTQTRLQFTEKKTPLLNSNYFKTKKSFPVFDDDSLSEEVEVYPGSLNSISIKRKYSKTFQCQFDLTRYPFDKQICEMELTMLSASSRLLQFDEKMTTAEFSGNRHLIEYTVGEVKLHFQNKKDFAILFIEVELTRRAGFILMNVYIPSMCLLVISYLTLYFKPTIFQVRMLGSLTTLLVMATLFTQASSQLPKSSYFKLVDVWLLSSILIIFMIIVFHAIIDRLQDTPKPEIPKHPLSAIIIKPDMTQCKAPLKKKNNAAKSDTTTRTGNNNKVSCSMTGSNSPTNSSSSQDAHELVTTLAKLGVQVEDGSPSSSQKNGDPELNAGVGQTYREQNPEQQVRARRKDSFVAMERSDEPQESVEDFMKYKQGKIEWRFWKWSFKDVDKCRTMILASRIFILVFVLIFNIFYWSIALGQAQHN